MDHCNCLAIDQTTSRPQHTPVLLVY